MKLFYARPWTALAIAAAVLVGCGRTGDLHEETGKKTIEVSVFEGGFGIDFHLAVAREYERLHPDVKVNLWGDPRNAEKLRPRFVSGTPPDLVGADLPIWSLASAGQLYSLDDALGSPAHGQPDKTWRETLLPVAVNPLRVDGRHYGIFVDYSTSGLWYNVKMFRKYGWAVPKTWSDLLDLCEKVKAKGIDPIAFQGRYPSYITQVFEDLVQRIGGPQAWADMQNMKPGAWNSPAALRAARLISELRQKQYIRDSYMGLSHMEAQMKFVQGKAAMVTCGTWLKTEMRSNLPSGFQMAFFPVPMVEGGKGDPTAVGIMGGAWFVPAVARHPEIGADFLKFLTSLEHARTFARKKDSLLTVKGSDTGLSPELESVARCMRRARFSYVSQLPYWYPSFVRTWYNEAVSNLMNKKFTPERFCDYLERAAENLRQDTRVKKQTIPTPGTEEAASAAILSPC